MSRTRIRHIAALAATAGVTAAVVSVVPTFAADSTTTTTTKTTPGKSAPARGDGACKGGPGQRGGGGPLGIAGAAMRPDPPAPAKTAARKAGKRAENGNGRPAGGPPNGGPGGPDGGPGPGGPGDDEQLANRTAHYAKIGKTLNKDTADVTAAVRTALVNDLDAKVKAGTLTQAREDALLKAWDAGDKPAKPDAGDKPAKADPPTPAEHDAQVAAFRKDVASALGVSVEDLVKAIDASKPTKAERAAKKAERKADNG